MCLLTCLSRFVIFNQLVANRRMCIDIKQLDVQGTRLRFYIYYNIVSPLKMANSFGMSVPITISTHSRPPIDNTTCRFGFSTVQRRNGIKKKNCLESTRINFAQLLSIWEPEPWRLTKSSTDGDANPTSQCIRLGSPNLTLESNPKKTIKSTTIPSLNLNFAIHR